MLDIRRKLEETVDTSYTQDRELSWLRFNERVLDEATDETVDGRDRAALRAHEVRRNLHEQPR